MKKDKILLLTDVFPCKNYSGAILSLQLCKFLIEEKYKLYCACVKSENIVEKYDDEIYAEIECIEFKKPKENSKNEDNYLKKVEDIIEQITDYIKEKDINIVWCPIQGETLLLIFNAIQKKFPKIKTICQIWDPIEWFLYELKYSEDNTKRILKLFYKTIKNSFGVLTASDEMNRIYKEKYNQNCYPSYLSLDLLKSSNVKKDSDKFIIIMSGQTYASVGIEKLINSLDKINWKYKNKKIIIRYFGNSSLELLHNNPNIDYKGFIAQDQLIKEQEKANLLYCSYFFDNNPAFKIVSQESYPSKVTSYIPAQVPILIHSLPDTSVYKHIEKYNAGYLLDSLKSDEILNKIKFIIDNSNSEQEKKLISNANKLFEETFSREKNKDYLFKTFDIPYTKDKKYSILEVNYVDLPGKRFNGYDFMNYLNDKTEYTANQIVTYKTSDNCNVLKLYNNLQQELEYIFLSFEAEELSVHSCLSCSSQCLINNDAYKNCDLLHLHMIHNTKLSLISLVQICNEKPTIISIHDPWTFTGRCVHYEECDKYLTGCHNCPNLDSLFPLKYDNCNELWKLKKLVYDNIDVDYVVSSQYMYDLFKQSPLTKNKRVHLIPFGMDIDYFTNNMTNAQARKKYNIDKNDIVLFHRAQKDFKGTNYFVEALEKLETDRKITIITCSEKGLLNSVKSRYRIIDLGNIDSEELKFAFNACDIFIMPSIGESFGMMAIEAMSCGKPVICFDNTALPSVTFAPKCGIAVENKNSEKLMEAIKYLVEDDKEREKRGKLARKLTEENYNVDIYNQKMTDLCREVLKRKHDFSGKKLLNKPIIENLDVKYMKNKLNKLSFKLFHVESPEYKKIYYDMKDFEEDDYQIKYSNINVQLLLNDYNKNVVNMYKSFYEGGKIKYPGLARFKLYRMIKRFFYLLTHDRKLLIITIKRKLNRFPKLKLFLKNIYNKIKRDK